MATNRKAGDVDVTVLIDTYNAAHLLPRAIESALTQTYPANRMEIVVVDDGSTDGTREVVSTYGEKVRYVFKSNGGQASAINEGIRQARGEIVCLLDGDDYFYPGKVDAVVKAFGEPGVGLVYTKLDIEDGEGTTIQSGYPPGRWRGSLRSRTLLGYPWGAPTSAMSIRRSIARDFEVPEEIFPTSPDVFLGSILPLATDAALVDRSLGAWVLHGTNQFLVNPAGPYSGFKERSRLCVRRYGEDRLGQRFVTYLGRGGYGLPEDADGGPARRVATYWRDLAQILAADVEIGLKLRAQLKLTASLLMPGTGRITSRRTTDAGIRSS